MYSTRVLFIAILLLFIPGLNAQQDMGYITGQVTDATGATVPGAQITVIEMGTAVKTSTITGETGTFTVGPLKIGTYEVQVERDGFRRAVSRDISVSAQDRRRLDVRLELGQVTESVTTTAEAPLLETETAAISRVASEQAIRQLPLNGRNFQTLALLSSGTVPALVTRDSAGGFNSHGQAAVENSFLIDGIDNNSYGFALEDRKAQVVIPSLDAVQEFKLQTSNYSAEFGRAAGGVMNVSIKSGTNQFHGTAYEYLRNDIFDARDTFSYVDRDGDGKADPAVLRQNQFGVTFGGPIVRNRSFFFGSWEGLRLRQPQSFLETVPTQDERAGRFLLPAHGTIMDPLTRQPFAGNIIPASRIDPVAARLLELYPVANFTGSGARSNYISQTPWKQTRNQVDARVDHNFSENDKAFARVSITRFRNERFPSLPIPARGGQGFEWNPSNNPAHSAALSWTKILSPALINEARVGFSRLNVEVGTFTDQWLAPEYGLSLPRADDRIFGLPRINFTGRLGYTSIGESLSAPTQKISQNWQFLNNVTAIRSSHTLKAGIDLRFTRADNFSAQSAHGAFDFNGRYTGVSIADFLLGMSNSYNQTNLQYVDGRFNSYMFYFQDDWKITPKLTLNFGLRYELTTPMWDKYDRQNRIILDPGAQFGSFRYAGAGDGSLEDRTLIQLDKNNWAPRIGLAYRIGERWTTRAGFGIFYGGLDRIGTGARMMANWPFNVRKSVVSTPTTPAVLLSSGVPPDFVSAGSTLPENSDLFSWSENFPITQIAQWNASVQRQIGRDLVLEVAYVGSSTSYIRDNYNLNAPLPGDPATEIQRRLIPALNSIQLNAPFGHSSYNGLDVQLEKRFSQGFLFSLGYGWGHAISNVGEQWGPDVGMQSVWDFDSNRGTTGFNIRHRFVASYVYELPFGKGRRWANENRAADLIFGGWNLNGITSIRSGQPFNPTLPNARIALGTAAVQQWRPDRIASGSVDDPNPERWFDTSAFIRPCDATGCRLGNSGVNILTAGGQVNSDFGVTKYFPLTERFRLQLRVEAFNIFNTPAYGIPNSNLESPDVGKVRSTVSTPRVFQYALRLEF
jgi:hypothetical protein